MKRVAILTSGGDSPGMNAAIRAATALFCRADIGVFGVHHGYRGLVLDEMTPLTMAEVGGILREGGTMLGSARCPEFHEPQTRAKVLAHLEKRGIDGCLVIGGNGSMAGLQALLADAAAAGKSLRGMGVPASIDNDIGLTGSAIGVDTAMNTIVEAVDKIADTASAFDRTFIVEVMGRDSGYLAMTSAVAAGADAVLFPESQLTNEEVVDRIVETAVRAASRTGRDHRAVIIKAEGTPLGVEELKSRVDERLKSDSSGAKACIETRVTVLGHVVRGGRPSAFDRLLASRLARVATVGLLEGDSGKMSAWLLPTPLPETIATRSEADPYCSLVRLDAVLAETRAMLDGTSPLVQWRRQVFDQIEDVLSL